MMRAGIAADHDNFVLKHEMLGRLRAAGQGVEEDDHMNELCIDGETATRASIPRNAR